MNGITEKKDLKVKYLLKHKKNLKSRTVLGNVAKYTFWNAKKCLKLQDPAKTY